MIPGTLLGLVALAAALGPGYLYVRRAELHQNRPVQSQLGELVEMVVIGGGVSLIAAGVVLGVATSTGFLATAGLKKDATGYLLDEPWRCFAVAAAFYISAYLIALVGTHVVHRRSPASIVPGLTGWTQAMHGRVPEKKAVVVRVELRDGRKFAGALAGFTPALEGNREILLRAPIIASAGVGKPPVELVDDFLAFREEQIALLSGSYVEHG